MTWKEKLAVTREDAARIPEMIMCFHEYPCASEAFIHELRSKFPFVDEEYIEFLRQTDGARFFVFALFGSERSWDRTILGETARWKREIDDGGVVISADAYGNPIVLCKDRRVRLLDFREIDKMEDGVVLADTFASFLSDVLMGDRLSLLMGGEIPADFESEWITHLRRHGWLKKSGGSPMSAI